MGNTRMINPPDLLDPDGEIPQGRGGSRITRHLTAMVSAVTERPSSSPMDTGLRCRRRPPRKPCPGVIQAGFEPGTSTIRWQCSACDDQSWICGWHETRWDKGGRVGLPRIDRIVYRHGQTHDIETGKGLEENGFEGSQITDEIVRAIHDNELRGASGFYGNPTAGDSLQVDSLAISHDGESTAIILCNRAIMLLGASEEFYVQVHRVCCRIERLAGQSQDSPSPGWD